MLPGGAIRAPAEHDAEELGRLVVGDHPPARAPAVDPLQGPRRVPAQVEEAADDGVGHGDRASPAPVGRLGA
eukprot:10393723-Lingulodinium_polyedra.AAC.1